MKNVTGLLIGAAILTGCATDKKITSLDPKIEKEISDFESTLSNHEMKQDNILAPMSFKKAKKILKESKKMAYSGASFSKVDKKINQGEKELDKLSRSVTLAKVHMKSVLNARQEAVEEGASYLESFKDADEDFAELAISIENKDINEVIEEKEDVEKAFVNSEIEAIQKRELKMASQNIVEADKMDGFDYFDREAKLLNQHINSSKKIIASNKDTPSAYEASVAKANDLSQKLLALTQTATWIGDTGTRKLTLTLSGDLDKVAGTFIKDPSTLNYSNKMALIGANAARVPFLESELTASQMTAYSRKMKLQDAKNKNTQLNSRLTRDRMNAKKIAKIEAMFKPSEAKIVKDGNDLVIKLIGLNFNVGSAKLPSNSANILQKVTKSMKEFNVNKVTIKGHADSTGNALFNEKLSAKRAEVVGDYLKNKVSSIDTQSIGMGFRRPYAENKTTTGRKNNRRIDIVLDSVVN